LCQPPDQPDRRGNTSRHTTITPHPHLICLRARYTQNCRKIAANCR